MKSHGACGCTGPHIHSHGTRKRKGCCCWVLHFLSILGHQRRFRLECQKGEKFCSEALISAWGSFRCRKSTTRDPWLSFPSEGSHTQDFYALKKSIDPGRDRIREPRIQEEEVWLVPRSVAQPRGEPPYSFYRMLSGPQGQCGHEGVKKHLHFSDTRDRNRTMQPVT